MLYLGIDQHAMQLTIDLGDEDGNLVDHRQVSTEWKCLRKFLQALQKQAAPAGGYVATLEVCGFNDYLLDLLRENGCKQVLLVQPEKRNKKKTDRRDARRLRELLWVNRKRILSGKRAAGFRVVRPATEEENAARQITMLRTRLTRLRTAAINKVKGLVRKHNLQHHSPTKGIQTKRAMNWLRKMELNEVDRLEMDVQLDRWELYNAKLRLVDKQIKALQQKNDKAVLLDTIPGVSIFGSLALASRVGDHRDFPRGASLANYWGLTPGSNNSDQSIRSGNITKEGSPLARYVLSQAVLHVLRKDPWMRKWYQGIKRRRGVKTARVAVMRRLATVIWSMLTYHMPYIKGGPKEIRKQIELSKHLREQGIDLGGPR